MYLWYVIFAHDPEKKVLYDSWSSWPGSLDKFRLVCRDGVLNGRYVLGMWVIHQNQGGVEILERFGRIPNPLMNESDLGLIEREKPF